jgi:tetratricopeptide (TPR) repeat protein
MTADKGEAAAEAVKQGLENVLGVLSGEVIPALHELKPSQEEKPFDFSPVTERIDGLKEALEKTFKAEDLKPHMESLSAVLAAVPADVAARLHELESKDDSNPMEGVEKRLEDLSAKLLDLEKTAGDREFVGAISLAIDGVGGKLQASNTSVLEALNEIPAKIDKLDEGLSDAVKKLLEKTDSLMKETGENLAGSSETLKQVKEELEKGLRLNTEMTGRMVDITSAFADRAREDMLSDLNSRAVAHYNRGEYSQADQLFQEALETAPQNPEILCNRGHVLAALEKPEESEESFRKALELAPEMEPAFSSLGLLMVKTGRAEETIEFLRKHIENGEPSVLTAVAYSRALAATGKHEQAVDLLEMCLRGSPDSPELKDELTRYGYEKDD